MKSSQKMWEGPARCNDKDLRRLIQENSIVRKLRAGEYYLSPGDPIYYVAYVAKGVTSHYMFSANGREKVMYRLGAGWFFSEGIFYNEKDAIEVATRSAIAEEETVLWLLDREHFIKLLGNRQFVEAVLHSTVEKCTILRYEIESLTFDSTSDRLKKLLLSCVDNGHLNDGNWYDLCVEWTHQNIAAVMGINRVTVSRFIAELKNEGFLRMVNGHIQISKIYFDLLGE